MSFKAPIKYSEIFDDNAPDLESLLLSVPKSIFQALGPSLISVSDPHNNFDDNKILRKYFSLENQGLKDAIKTIISTQNSRCLHNPITAYRIMEYYFILPLKETVDLSHHTIELNFWKAYLILNEQFNNKSNDEVKKMKGTKNALLKNLISSINIHDIANYNQRIVLLSQIIKSVRFFEFLESDPKFHPYLNKFLELKNCKNYKQYLIKIYALVAPSLGQIDKTFSDLIVTQDKDFEENNEFLESFSFDESTVKELPDFVGLRSSPLMKISKGQYRIISLLFLIETLYKSIRFFITRPVHDKLASKDQISIYSIISGEFSENIVLYESLDKIISDKYTKVRGEEFKNLGIEESEPDYLAYNEQSILLFESKDVILKGEIKQSLEFELIEEGLINKFHKTNENEKGGGVGIPQLVENVLRICEGYYNDIIQIANKSKTKIYPILVIHDRQFDTPGINKLLISWFKSELIQERENQDISKVQNLTIINNDQLLALQNILINSKIELKGFIDKYHKKLSNPKRKRNPDMSFLMEKFNSFSTFLEIELKANNNYNLDKIFEDYICNVFKDELAS